MMKSKILYLGVILGLFLINPLILSAPTYQPKGFRVVKVRLTCYSPKEKYEGNKTATGKCAKNENGVATHKLFLPLGTEIMLPDNTIRKIDDRIPTRSAKKFNYRVVDIRYYDSIKSKTKTLAVKKELRQKDMGWDYIRIIE